MSLFVTGLFSLGYAACVCLVAARRVNTMNFERKYVPLLYKRMFYIHNFPPKRLPIQYITHRYLSAQNRDCLKH